MPGNMAYLSFTFVLGMKMYNAVNMPHVSAKGVSLTRNLTIGANTANSAKFFKKVDMKMEIPLDNRTSKGRSRSMEK